MQLFSLKRILIILSCFFIFPFNAFSQRARFSLSTDVSLLHDFKKDQRYWALGQTLTGHFNFAPKEGLYVWLAYYNNGKFTNELTADAKDSLVSPQQVNFSNHAKMRFQHFSIGWKHYLKGTFDAEEKWNLYCYAGFGVMFGVVQNTHSPYVDSASYSLPVSGGKGNFKRLTLDLGLGYEIPAGGDVYFYGEARAFVPTTDYPSDYLLVNENAPFSGSLNIGIRILFP